MSNLQHTMKYLYLVDHFCNFPRSEYGGLWAVIAKDKNECFDLIKEYDDGFNEDFYVNLREKVVNARTFAIVEDEQSRVVEAFTT
jgi:hypothetical protein